MGKQFGSNAVAAAAGIVPTAPGNSILGVKSSGSANALSQIGPSAGGQVTQVTTPAVTADVLTTILSLTGSGVIPLLALQSTNATVRSHRIKVTIDGNVVFDSTSAALNTTSVTADVYGVLIPVYNSGSLVSMTYSPDNIGFRKSLLIEYASNLSETGGALIAYRYLTT